MLFQKNGELISTSDFVRIPLERVGALIGRGGETKKEIEKKTKATLKIDSQEGEVGIFAKEINEGFFKAKDIVRAIGRGFSPEKAFRLLEPDCFLSIIELSDVAGTKKEMEHKRGRVIGTSGRAREEIEEDTGASVSIYGKTVAIIGTGDEIEQASRAVEMLLHGASHETVYYSLKKELHQKKFEL